MPPPTDPSAYTDQPDDPTAALLELNTMPEANEGSLELTDGAYGDRNTVGTDNVLPPACKHRTSTLPTANPARCSVHNLSPSNCCCSKNSEQRSSTRPRRRPI